MASSSSSATKSPAAKEPAPSGLQAFAKWATTTNAKYRAERRDPAFVSRAQLWNQAYYRTRWEMTWQPFFNAVGLSAEEREKFLAVRLEYAAKLVELNALIDEGQLKRRDPGVTQFKAQANAEQQSALAALLGQGGMEEFAAYARTEPARDLVAGIAGSAVMAGVPLTASQLEQLVRTVANASVTYQQGQAVAEWDIDWNAVDAQARMFLSNPQWTAMTTLLVSSYADNHMDRFATRLYIAKHKVMEADAASKAPQR